MTNRGGGSKQHGGHQINERRRKSVVRVRRNKALAQQRRLKLRAEGLNC